MKETKFKQTEVGMIPSDWEVKTLGELFDFSAGGDLQKESFSEYPSGTIKWPIYSNSLENKGLYGYTSNPRYRANCVTITGRGSLGHAEYRREAFDAIVRLLVLSPKQHVDCYFVSETINFRVPFVFESTGVPQLTAPQAVKSKIPLPPTIEEQQRIANALSDVDTLIANLEKLIAKKKNIKQGAMQQLLTGKKRLPGFAPAKPTYKQTEIGQIPTDWEVKKIGDFTKLQAGGTPSTLCDDFWGGNIRWMNSGELNNKRIYDVSGRITELGLNSSSTHLIPPNCVLVGLAGQGKTRGTAAINYVELCTNQSIAAMFPSKTHNSEYLYHNIDSRYEELRELSSGDGGRGGLNLKILANLFIALPSKEEQTAIANVLSDMDAEISALETKLAKYRTLKTGMMQQLLTGKIRLL
ncbi:hypothetical protein B7982_07465 [Fibrobacter sp. UWB2]|uniref:restriction endonuclease subunit S n=1 Tax=Fibrobacter sp. UWB2 TaxID=1964358 RepID=UPI000B527EF0|nr:restriction endonuclease subunit S [Fibrobacter sp. UWB2]OWV23299.1 hypothetical protein B7982_07465 [Fibrobacter sp. UWB2]